VGVDGARETHQHDPGRSQVILFAALALSIGLLGLWLGGLGIAYLALVLFGLLFGLFFAGRHRYRFLLLYLLTTVGLFVGGLIYARLTDPPVVEAMRRLPLIGPLMDWPALQVGLAVLTGLLAGGMATYGSLELSFSLSINLMLGLRQIYSLDHKTSRKLILSALLGKSGAVLVADEGKLSPDGDLARFGVPLLLRVKPYHAVVLEQGDEVSRIVGQGLHVLQAGEGVKAVVDLRTQGGDYTLESVLTKDNVPLKVKGVFSFRIESWQEARDRDDKGDIETQGFPGMVSGRYPVYQRTVYRAVYALTAGKTLSSQLQGMAAGQVAVAIRRYRVDEIFVVDEGDRVSPEPAALQKILEEAKQNAIKAATKWGVTFNGLNVTAIEMPPEAQAEFLKRWSAPWQGWQEIQKAREKVEIARLNAEASVLTADGKRHSTYQAELGKVQAWEEQFKRTLRVMLSQLSSIKDDKLRIQAVVEVIRALQPADRRILNLLLQQRGLPKLNFGSPESSSEESESEE